MLIDGGTYQSEGWKGNLIQWCRTTGAGFSGGPERRVLIDASSRVGSRPVSRVLSGAIIPLGPVSPQASSGLPGSACGFRWKHRLLPLLSGFPIWSCSRWGLPCRRMLPPARCALTAPFHPCRRRGFPLRLGGLLSVALSVGSHPPGVTWHLIRRSPDFPPPPACAESSDCPADSPRAPYGASSVLASFIAKA